jgi:1-aminocyclopropane-1-carboxylate deaminase
MDFKNITTEGSYMQQLDISNFNLSIQSIFIKRDDLIHPLVSGNKWRKLQLHIQDMQTQGYDKVITFGGAFSNHIYAAAAFCKINSMKSIGIIRGEDVANPTLDFARASGMQLTFLDRNSYRSKDTIEFLENLKNEYPDYYLIPEGGASILGINGCESIIHEINKWNTENKKLHIVVSAGTGTTAAGIIKANTHHHIHVISALKGNFIAQNIENKIGKYNHYTVHNDYHWGGYAKWDTYLISFINKINKDYNLPLDIVYTGKMLHATIDLIKKEIIPPNASIICIHTGGLQGNLSFNFLQGKELLENY